MSLSSELLVNFNLPLSSTAHIDTSESNAIVQKHGRTWTSIGYEVFTTSLPFLALYSPFGFSVSVIGGSLRLKDNLGSLKNAIQASDYQALPKTLFSTSVAIIGLTATFLFHPIGKLIKTSYDFVSELKNLCRYLHEQEYALALASAFKVLDYAIFFAILIKGGPEILLVYYALQIVLNLIKAKYEFEKDRIIAGGGRTLLSIMNINRTFVQLGVVLQIKK